MKKFFVLLSLSLLSACASQKKDGHPQSSCDHIRSCLNLVGQLTGQKYSMSGKLEDYKVSFSDNQIIDADNADLVLTNILMLNNLARIPSGQPKSYYIVEAKEAIQAPVSVFEGSLEKPAVLPKTFDFITLKYKTVDPDKADFLQRFITDLVPRYGRVTSYPDSGVLLITDTALNVAKIVDILKTVDKPLTAKFKKELEERRKARQTKEKSGDSH